MIIREIADYDFNGLMNLYAQLHNTTIPESGETLKKLWNRILDDRDHHIIVAEENGELVSSCVCVIIQCLTRDQKPFAVIENVITSKEHRKKGLATACLNYAKEIAVRENCYKIMLMTGSKLDSTFRFYEKAGYNRRDKTAFIQRLNP